MIDLLIKLLPWVAPALRFADNFYWPWQAPGIKAAVLWPFLVIYTLLVWIVDMVIAELYFLPHHKEWTISHTLERTIFTDPDCLRLAMAIDSQSSGHIKNLKLLKPAP